MKKKIMVLVGGSGSGKTTIANILISNYGFDRVITTTTRDMRPGETSADYNFVSIETFKNMKSSGKFIETTVYGNNMYGTSKEAIEKIISKGCPAIIIMDQAGAYYLRQVYGSQAYVVHIDRNKRDLVRAILERDVPLEEKVTRIVQLDRESQDGFIKELYDKRVINEDVEATAALLAECFES